MAINQFAQVTLDPNTAAHPDRADYRNIVAAAAAGGSHLTVSWDSAVITTLTKWDACVAAARQIAAGNLTP